MTYIIYIIQYTATLLIESFRLWNAKIPNGSFGLLLAVLYGIKIGFHARKGSIIGVLMP